MLDQYIEMAKEKKLKTIDSSQFYHLSKIYENFIQGLCSLKIDRTMEKCVRQQIFCWSSVNWIPHNRLMAKLHASGFSEHSLIFFNSCLKRHMENVQINSTYSLFKELLSQLVQGSILGLILFNIFINIYFFG